MVVMLDPFFWAVDERSREERPVVDWPICPASPSTAECKAAGVPRQVQRNRGGRVSVSAEGPVGSGQGWTPISSKAPEGAASACRAPRAPRLASACRAVARRAMGLRGRGNSPNRNARQARARGPGESRSGAREDDLALHRTRRKQLERLSPGEQREGDADQRIDSLLRDKREDLREVLSQRLWILSIQQGDAVESAATASQTRSHEEIDEHGQRRDGA